MDYKALLAQANEALYNAYEAYPALGVGAQCSEQQTKVVLDVIWPEIQKLEAQVLEYEHALDHIASDYEPSHPAGTPRCQDCVNLAKSALAGENRADFLEIVTDG